MATAVLEGLAEREAREQARIEAIAEEDQSTFMTAYVSPDDDEEGLPEMEGLGTATIAEVAPAAAAAVTPIVAPEVVELAASEPVAEATVNLLVLMSKSPSIPVAPVTAKVPATTVLPVADATENLLVAIVRLPLKV